MRQPFQDATGQEASFIKPVRFTHILDLQHETLELLYVITDIPRLFQV